MYSVDLIAYIITLLKSNNALRDCAVVAAYPDAYKPTRTEQTIVAVSQSGLEAKSVEIGKAHLYGNITVRADIFVPQRLGSPCTQRVADNVMNVLATLNPRSMEAGMITRRDDLGSYAVRCLAVMPYYDSVAGE